MGRETLNPVVRILRRVMVRDGAQRVADRPNPYGVHVLRDLPYRADGRPEHLLDVYAPVTGVVPLPVIVELHGGGYICCNKEFNAQHGQYLASRGFCVVNMNYTLAPEGGLGEILNELVDVLAWVRNHSTEYGFDTSRVFLTGDSAGGHVVLLSAAMFTTGRAADFFRVRRPPLKVLGYAASCPEGSFEWRLLPHSLPVGMNFLMLHKYTLDKEYARRSSYEDFMTRDYPRVWFCTSPTDTLLYNHTRQMHEFMLQKGIDHEYREYLSQTGKLEHVFNVLQLDDPESQRANEDMLAFFRGKMRP